MKKQVMIQQLKLFNKDHSILQLYSIQSSHRFISESRDPALSIDLLDHSTLLELSSFNIHLSEELLDSLRELPSFVNSLQSQVQYYLSKLQSNSEVQSITSCIE